MNNETSRLNSIMAPFNLAGAMLFSPIAFIMGNFVVGAPKPDMSVNEWKQFALHNFIESAPHIILYFGTFSFAVNYFLLSLAPQNQQAIRRLFRTIANKQSDGFDKTNLITMRNTLLMAFGWAFLVILFWLIALACGCYLMYRQKPAYFG